MSSMTGRFAGECIAASRLRMLLRRPLSVAPDAGGAGGEADAGMRFVSID
jgi:hypothetical protein